MPDGFTFEDDDKKSAAAPNKGGFSWEDDKSAPPKEAPAAASSAPAKQPEGMWHSAATAMGINPEQVSAAMVHPWESLKSAGSEALSELRHPGTVLSQAAQSLPSLLNPEAQQTAVSRMKSPGWKNKILGGEEYLESGIPGVGSNLVKSHEQAAQGNYPGMTGTIAGTVLPSVIDPGVRANIGEMMPSKAVATLPMRAAVRGAEHAVNDLPGLNVLRAGKGLMQPADEAVKMRIKLPGRDFGLPAPAEAMPAVESNAPAEAASQPYSAGMPAVREPGRVGPPLQRLEELIQQASGVKPLEPAISLRNQLPNSVGAAAEGFPQVGEVPLKNMGGPVTFRREPIVKTVPGLEEGPLRAQAPEGLPTVATEEPARQMGAPPLQPAVPLRQQLKVTGMEPASRQATLEEKYPDREVRQLVHANGEDIVQAAGQDRETLKAIHDLKNPDVRQALINSGEDMGQVSIGNRKAMGESQLSRQDAFKKLLAKGYSPKQIVDLAKQEMKEGGTGAGKPGPMRATGERPAREKTGD